MVNLVYTPQRADFKAEYIIDGEALTIKINDIIESFDFSNLAEGQAKEIIIERLPVNPVISVEKEGDTVNITVIRFYSFEEKKLFENI